MVGRKIAVVVGALLFAATLAAAPASAAEPAYRIQSVHSGLCITANLGGFDTYFYQQDCNFSRHFRQVSPKSGDGFYLQDTGGKQCVDVYGGKKDDNIRLLLFPCIREKDTNNQIWRSRDRSGAVELVARHSNKCMDVRGASKEPSAQIIQYSCNGQANQLWRFIRVG